MKAKLISCLRDIKADSCGPISTFDTERDLIRSLQEFAKAHPESLPAQHPHDFVVLVVGTWNPDTGKLETTGEPMSLGSLYDILTPSKPEAAVMPIRKNKKK